MHIVVHTHALFPLALASAHAATDFSRPLPALSPYLMLVAWPSTVPVTPLFFAASVVHFGRDVGTTTSLLLHIVWCVVASVDTDVSFSLFTLYYCGVHAPAHCMRHARDWPFVLAAMALCAAVFATLTGDLDWTQTSTVVIEEWMQRLVIAHVLCDELERER
jgi:hypothetical protein